jgi:enediyne biosynthesis protein E4
VLSAISWVILAGCVPVGPGGEEPTPAPTPAPVDDDDAAGPLDLSLGPFTDGPELDFGFAGWASEDLPTATEDRTNGGGGALVDLDADGDLDLVLTSPIGENAVFLNDGDAGFTELIDSGFVQAPWSSSVTVLDLDADGLPEVLLGADRQLLLHPNTGGRFGPVDVILEVAEGERVEGAAAADFDGDGFVDLYVSVQGRHENEQPFPVPFEPHDRLLRGQAGGGFVDRSDLLDAGARAGQSYVAGLMDVDADGRLDVFSIKDRGERLEPNRLFLNPGGFDDPWTEASEPLALDLAIDGMGVASGDIGNDGTVEVILTDNGFRLHVLTLSGGGSIRHADGMGLVAYAPEVQESSWGPALSDLDHDGDLDAIVSFGPVVAGLDVRDHQNGLWEWTDEGFVGREELLGAEITPPSVANRCPLVGDLNGDGCPDIVFVRQLGPPRIRLGTPNDARFLRVRLRGPAGNGDGLGARVVVESARLGTQERVVASGHQGVHSSGPLHVEFGLADEEAERIVVHWPDGTVTEAGGGAGLIEVVHPDR